MEEPFSSECTRVAVCLPVNVAREIISSQSDSRPSFSLKRPADEDHGISPESITEIPHLLRAAVGQ